jgi:hypothetical protein
MVLPIEMEMNDSFELWMRIRLTHLRKYLNLDDSVRKVFQ